MTTLVMTNANTSTRLMPCTTAKSLFCAACDEIGAEAVEAERGLDDRGERDQARDGDADDRGDRDGGVAQHVAAHDSDHGRPRLTAVCTCSLSSSSRTAARVTRVDEGDRRRRQGHSRQGEMADRVEKPAARWPSTGNQPSLTPNTNCSRDRSRERRAARPTPSR